MTTTATSGLRLPLALGAALGVLVHGIADAHWAMPTDAPVARLVANLQQRVVEHPDDAEAWFLLGRVNGLAFSLRTQTVGVYGASGDPTALPTVPDRDQDRHNYVEMLRLHAETPDFWPKPTQGPPGPTAILAHLAQSVTSFRRSIELQPSSARTHLGLAYVLERGAHLADQVDTAAGVNVILQEDALAQRLELLVLDLGEGRDADERRSPALAQLRSELRAALPILLRYRADPDARRQAAVAELLTDFWREESIREYLAAFDLAIDKDMKIDAKPLAGLSSLIGYEAGRSYLRLVDRRGERDLAEHERVSRVRTRIGQLEAKPDCMAITPIVFALDGPRPLRTLVADHGVDFDLDGNGIVERWQWVKGDTAILVWDPRHTGRITSGRQLFGGATWWMLFADGYAALDSLDDDRDGWLAGAELRDLAIWTDRNENGVSEPGEVQPLVNASCLRRSPASPIWPFGAGIRTPSPIAAIATRAGAVSDDGSLNAAGLRLLDRTVLPTYDWISTREAAPR